MLRLNASTLLSTYVGHNCGERILSGAVHRGDGEQISAIILFVDIKNYTRMSNSTSGRELLKVLNDTFDALVPQIEQAGGEILKFLGDGFFAIFPYGNEDEIPTIAALAIEAVNAGRNQILRISPALADSYRVALHFGDFHYGNIGGANRLDFTAIGPPVNYAARLLTAATELGADRVMSADLAKKMIDGSKKIGEVSVKGFAGKQTIFGF